MYSLRFFSSFGSVVRSGLTAVALFGLVSTAIAARLHDAAKGGDADEVRSLVAAGADLDEADRFGPPLLHAAARGHVAIIEILVEAGADPNATSNEGATALHRASYRGDREAVAMLLAAGADPNRANHAAGLTPLHGAALGGHVECLRLLLEKGGDPDRCDNHGLTPLTRAAGKCAECVQVLLD